MTKDYPPYPKLGAAVARFRQIPRDHASLGLRDFQDVTASLQILAWALMLSALAIMLSPIILMTLEMSR